MEFAKGGYVPESKVNTLKLDNGYWVVTPGVVEKYGEEFLDKLNQMTLPEEGK